MKHVHFTKHMIDLFFEIRGRQTAKTKSKLKISASNIDGMLFELYRKTKDEKTKELIAQFMLLAGDHFHQKILDQKKTVYNDLVAELHHTLKHKKHRKPKRSLISLTRQTV